MPANRDDFLKPTRDTLAARAGLRCSNPSCRRATAKADPSDEENWIDLGIAAHITAASPGGPRFDPSLSPEERRSAKNGIWLCYHCAKEADSATSTYTVPTLRTWKTQAEACTARDAAATLDEISHLIAAIEQARSAIDAYVKEVRERRQEFDTLPHDENTRELYIQKLIQQGSETQIGWDARLAPRIRELLVRGTGMLGSQHAAIVESQRVASFARTNPLAMQDMADKLDSLRAHLLLR
jgi:hypothetical protein